MGKEAFSKVREAPDGRTEDRKEEGLTQAL